MEISNSCNPVRYRFRQLYKAVAVSMDEYALNIVGHIHSKLHQMMEFANRNSTEEVTCTDFVEYLLRNVMSLNDLSDIRKSQEEYNSYEKSLEFLHKLEMWESRPRQFLNFSMNWIGLTTGKYWKIFVNRDHRCKLDSFTEYVNEDYQWPVDVPKIEREDVLYYYLVRYLNEETVMRYLELKNIVANPPQKIVKIVWSSIKEMLPYFSRSICTHS